MLDNIFLQIFNMSITSAIVISFVLVARLALKKAPKIFSYALWSVVLFRLVCPFTFESIASILPTRANPISQDIMYMQAPQIDTGIVVINNAVNAVLPKAAAGASVNPLQLWLIIGSIIWVIGMLAMLVHSIIALIKLRNRLKLAVHYSENVFLSGKLNTALVMGLIRPRIYLPIDLSNAQREYILLHERTHINRCDHIIKLISFLTLCIHWFNPFVWIAFFASGKDMEMSCDEAVIKHLGNDVKKDYSSSLLSLATGKRLIGGTPLAFGEGDTKSRIKNVLSYKKPEFWVIIIAVIAVLAIILGLISSPVKPSNDEINNEPNENVKINLGEDGEAEKIADKLEQAIHTAILEQNKNEYHPAQIAAESHAVLATQADGAANNGDIIDTVTVYTLVLYEEFNVKDGKFDNTVQTGGSHIPTAITFNVDKDGNYTLAEYWQPRDGAYYAADIESKFPKAVGLNALDTQSYITVQKQDIYTQLILAGHINAPLMIESLIEDISKMDGNRQSNWRLNAALDELICYGNYMLDYSFSKFLKGEQGGKKSDIMYNAIRAILKDANEDISFGNKTGQAWFDSYLAHAESFAAKEGLRWVEKNMSKAYMLLIQTQNHYTF